LTAAPEVIPATDRALADMPSFRLSTKSSCHQMSRSRGATGGVLVSALLSPDGGIWLVQLDDVGARGADDQPE
jgi:hypothetical protein